MARMKLRMGSFGGTSRVGDIVKFDNQDWVCKKVTSLPPPDPEFWQPVAIRDPAFDVEGPQGPPGESIKGDKGDPGRDGQSIPGRDGSGFNWRGEWRRRTTYSVNDTVEREGSSYVCVSESTRSEPSENSRHWSLMAAKGEQGERGEAGFAGGRGRRGADGQTVVIPTDPFGTQTAQAFFDSAAVRGSVVRVSGDKHVDLAIAHGSDETALAVGLAVATTEADGFGSYVTGGPFTNEAWNLTPGACYYLSPTNPGEITEVYPNTIGDFVVILGIALTPKTLSLKIEWALYVGS